MVYGDVTKWLENNQSYGAHDFKATQNETNDHVFTKINIQSRFVFKLRTNDIYIYIYICLHGFQNFIFWFIVPTILVHNKQFYAHMCIVSHFGHDLKFKDDSSYLIFDDS